VIDVINHARITTLQTHHFTMKTLPNTPTGTAINPGNVAMTAAPTHIEHPLRSISVYNRPRPNTAITSPQRNANPFGHLGSDDRYNGLMCA
jgi:hypothetical protein